MQSDTAFWLGAEARFQASYARLLTDSRFRAWVLAPEAAEGGDFDLSLRERERLRAMDADRIELFAQCLVGNRMAAIAEAFPLTAKILGSSLLDLVQALDRQSIALDTRKYPEALRFANFLLNGKEDGNDDRGQAVPERALGLLHFELKRLNLRLRPQLENWPSSVNRSPDALQAAFARHDDLRPILDLNHAVVEVGYDIEALREVESEPWPELSENCLVLLHRGENGAVGELSLNRESAAAVLMIDGTRTFAGLLTDLGNWLGLPGATGLYEPVVGLCTELGARGVLGFVPADMEAGTAT